MGGKRRARRITEQNQLQKEKAGERNTQRARERHEKELPSKLRLLGDFGKRLTDKNLKTPLPTMTATITNTELRKRATLRRREALKEKLAEYGFEWHDHFSRSEHTATPEKLEKYLEKHGIKKHPTISRRFISISMFDRNFGLNPSTMRTIIRAIESHKIKLTRLNLAHRTTAYIEDELTIVCQQPYIHQTLLHFAVSPHAKRYWEQRLKEPPFT